MGRSATVPKHTNPDNASDIITLPAPVPPLEPDHLSPIPLAPSVTLYNVPYSEHSSFRELACFIHSLSIRGRIQPTVHIDDGKHSRQMEIWLDKWLEASRAARANGLGVAASAPNDTSIDNHEW
jgi:hypothetical protein